MNGKVIHASARFARLNDFNAAFDRLKRAGENLDLSELDECLKKIAWEEWERRGYGSVDEFEAIYQMVMKVEW